MDKLMYIVPTQPANEYKFLDPKAVVYCELERDMLYVWLLNNEKVIINSEYKLFDELYSRPDFTEVKDSCLVNIRLIADYNNKKGIVEMKDGTSLKVDPESKAAFLKVIS